MPRCSRRWCAPAAPPSSAAYLIVAQVHAIGNLSLLIIVASGLAVGFVLALQLYYTLVRYGATDSLGLIVNLSLTRELGPVLAALLFAGRAGTSLTAEIGLMKAGEQLAALDMMALDPVERILAPRFLGGIIAMPVLAILFSTVGILAAYVLAVLLIGVDAGNFWSIMHSGVDAWRDVGNGIVKSVVFGLICTFVALYQGYEAEPTPEGRVRRDHARRGRRVAGDADHGFRADGDDVLDAGRLSRYGPLASWLDRGWSDGKKRHRDAGRRVRAARHAAGCCSSPSRRPT